ncbi:MAG: arylsulfatase [Verrucomicrobiales bacterium]
MGAAFSFWAACAPGAEKRPNIVIILADDMGFSDLACYGGEIETPHLDALAASGRRFTQFYNAGRCCPTRASFLTGLYQHQAGMGEMTNDRGKPGYRGRLNDKCVTVAEVAGAAGYLTAVSGKWHVGSAEAGALPLARGFQRFYGIPEGGGIYKALKKGRTLMLNDEVIARADEGNLPDDWYVTDAFTDYGLRFIDEAREAGKPFFLYLAHIAPHFPLQADAADIAKYEGRYADGWEAVARRRLERQVASALFPEGTKASGQPSGVKDWTGVKQKERFERLMGTYAACVERMDQSVGRLVAALRERGELENTLILFLSDNGASAEGGAAGRTEGDPTRADSNWWAGRSWAWVSNAPFGKFKKYAHEGGIATPLIAHWPAGLGSEGRWERGVAHIVDLMPTVVELTGGTYPAERKGQKVPAMEGRSLLPLLRGEPWPERALFWEHYGNAAVRSGDWKLVREGGKGRWELYDLATDRTERKNLAAGKEEIVQELEQQWLAWARRCGVAPDGRP